MHHLLKKIPVIASEVKSASEFIVIKLESFVLCEDKYSATKCLEKLLFAHVYYKHTTQAKNRTQM